MKCEDFLKDWGEGKRLSFRKSLAFILHWMRCREGRENCAFIRRRSRVLKGEEWADEAFFREMRRGLVEEGRKAGVFVSRPSSSRPFFTFPRLLVPLGGVLVTLTLALAFFLLQFPSKEPGASFDYGLYSWDGVVLVAQLDSDELRALEGELEGAFGSCPSLVYSLSITPWAEVMDQVSANSRLLALLLMEERSERAAGRMEEV